MPEDFTEDNLYIFYEFDLPLGWKVDNENEYYMIYKSENLIEDNINKLKSISQTSRFYCETNGNGNYVHNFSLPFELELLGHDAISENNTHYYYKLILLIDMVDIEYKVIHLLNYRKSVFYCNRFGYLRIPQIECTFRYIN